MMKKLTAFVLALVMVLSTAILPIMADGTTDTDTPVTPAPAATCVVGKTITIDGAMGADEGWSETPLYNMSLQVADPTKTTGTEDPEPATARYSYDTDYLYIYYETANTDTMSKHDASVYFRIFPKETHFNDANASANGETLQLRVMMGQENLTWEGKNSAGDAGAVSTSNLVAQFFYHKDNKAYAAGTTYFDDTKVAYTVTTEKKTIELRFPLAESYQNALSADGGANFRISMWERNNIPANNAGYIIAGGTYDWNGTKGADINLPQITAEVMTAVDVAGKTVTVDGEMGEDEGWAAYPFAYLDSQRTDPTSESTQTAQLTENRSTVRLSYDENYLYIYFETYQTTKQSVYFQIAYEGTNRDATDAKGLYIQIRVDTTTSAVSSAGIASPVLALQHKTAYTAGEDVYDKTVAATVVGDIVTSVEVAIPIPNVVYQARLNDVYESITFGAWERFAASENTGLVSSDGYSWTGGKMTFSMTKNESGEFEETMNWIEASKETVNHESLKNLTVNILGDDYMMSGMLNSAYMWTSMLDTKYEWTVATNATKGVMTSTYNKIQTLPLSKLYRQLGANSPNLVLVSGGLNDYLMGVPIGTIDDETTDTYMGALNTMIKGIRNKYPEACIVFITGYNYPNSVEGSTLTYQDYANAMVQVCEARQVYCFNAYDTTVSGVDMSSEEFRTANCMTADNTVNLNLAGMKLVMPKYEAFIAESIAHWVENKATIMENQKDFLAEEQKNNGGSANNGGNETTAPETSAPTTSTPTEKKGCGGVIGIGSAFAVLAIVSCAGVACFKKHDEE